MAVDSESDKNKVENALKSALMPLLQTGRAWELDWERSPLPTQPGFEAAFGLPPLPGSGPGHGAASAAKPFAFTPMAMMPQAGRARGRGRGFHRGNARGSARTIVFASCPLWFKDAFFESVAGTFSEPALPGSLPGARPAAQAHHPTILHLQRSPGWTAETKWATGTLHISSSGGPQSGAATIARRARRV